MNSSFKHNKKLNKQKLKYSRSTFSVVRVKYLAIKSETMLL